MRVTIHRQSDGRMSGELLGHVRMHTATGKVRNERVTEGVEVEYTARPIPIGKEIRLLASLAILIRFGSFDPACPQRLQVSSKHPGHIARRRHSERYRGRQSVGKIITQHARQLWTDRQHVLAPMLTRLGSHRHCRRVRTQRKGTSS
ncbi:MAG: hypothetical protein MI923_05705 [Phycisphaerales bacterium]|nr:hypothetical protein [Phycisphaerales bacterium]